MYAWVILLSNSIHLSNPIRRRFLHFQQLKYQNSSSTIGTSVTEKALILFEPVLFKWWKLFILMWKCTSCGCWQKSLGVPGVECQSHQPWNLGTSPDIRVTGLFISRVSLTLEPSDNRQYFPFYLSPEHLIFDIMYIWINEISLSYNIFVFCKIYTSCLQY